MKLQKKLMVCLSIAIVIGLVSPTTSFGMKRPRTGSFLEESPDITQHEDIQQEISQKFQQFPTIQNAIQFLAWQPITLKNTRRILSIATNGDIVVTGSEDGMAKIWNAATGQQLIPYADHGRPVNKVAISGNIIVSESLDNTINIWKTDGELLSTFKETSKIVKEAISNDKVATQSNDGYIKIWKTDGKLLRTFKEKSHVLTLIISGDKVITGSVNGTVNIRSITTGQLLRTLKSFLGRIKISNDKMITLSGVTAEIRNINTGELLHTLVDTVENNSVIIAGDKAITSTSDTAKIWDIHTGQVLHTFEWPLYWLSSIIVTGNKLVISLHNGFAVGATKGTVNVYDIQTGQLLHTFVVGWVSAEIEIANDTMITITRDNSVNIWNIDPFKGTPDTNPILWIINNATVPQLEFIKRAYEATVAEQEFILAIPSEDAKVFLSFPTPVKQYLLARLKIRR